ISDLESGESEVTLELHDKVQYVTVDEDTSLLQVYTPRGDAIALDPKMHSPRKNLVRISSAHVQDGVPFHIADESTNSYMNRMKSIVIHPTMLANQYIRPDLA
ncbi:hypothetical protein CVT25_000365, partial [Psilocybe cyanescens]